MSQHRPGAEFSNVDQAIQPEHLVQCLDFQSNTEFTQAYKQRTFSLLAIQVDQHILEVGCGTGQDAQEMAKYVGTNGRVIGQDISQTMIEIAQQRNQDSQLPVSFYQCDSANLPFANNTFDSCRADRVFQHLENPLLALKEMLRVTKPGGKILVVDPDHETRVIDTPYPDITRRFLQFRNSGLKQPGIAHQLYAMLRELGCRDIQVEPITQVTTDYEIIQPVARFTEGIQLAQQHGVIKAEEAQEWIDYIEMSIRNGKFFHALTSFVTLAYKAK